MNSTRATGATALLFGLFLLTAMAGTPQGQAPAPPAGAAGPQAPGGAPAGRAGGRGNPGAALWTEQCAGCHGNDLAGGRAPSLFDAKWLSTTSDDAIIKAIKQGVANTEMEPFAKALDDAQIWTLVSYIRSQSGALRPRRPFLADSHGTVYETEKQKVRVDVLATGLETPWGLAFLPDGRLLITERPGRLRIFADGKLSEAVKGTPAVHTVQDGGLFDVQVHPRYADNGWIYLGFSEVLPGYTPPAPVPAAADAAPVAGGAPQGRGRGPQVPSNTTIVRGKINRNNEWTDQQVIFRAAPELYTPSNIHYGIRFTFDREGHLFYSIGDRGSIPNAQDLGSPFGKIHRVNDDGTPVKDNPFVNRPGALATIWSYGNRNPQGLAWDPVTGKLWESEHGPNSACEINIIEKGHNYGWGVATKAVQAGMVPSAPGMDDPLLYYTPSMGPSAISFYSGNRYPGWRDTSLFVGGLTGQRLERLEITQDKITKQEILFDNLGRVRDIVQGPDGYFYLALQDPAQPVFASTPGKLVRLMPVP